MAHAVPALPRLQRGRLISGGLIASWPMFEGDGDRCQDVTFGRAAARKMIAWFVGDSAWVAGRHGAAVEFDGSSGYLEIGPTVSGFTPLVTQEPFSVSARFRMFDTAPFSVAFSVGRGDSGNQSQWFACAISGGNAVIRKQKGGTNETTEIGSVQANRWHHGLWVFESDTSRFGYVDGVRSTLTGTTAIGDLPDLNNTKIGAANRTAFGGEGIIGFFSGAISDVRVYKRVVDPSEARRIAAGWG